MLGGLQAAGPHSLQHVWQAKLQGICHLKQLRYLRPCRSVGGWVYCNQGVRGITSTAVEAPTALGIRILVRRYLDRQVPTTLAFDPNTKEFRVYFGGLDRSQGNIFSEASGICMREIMML